MTHSSSPHENEPLLKALLRSHGKSVILTYDHQLRCRSVETDQDLLFGIPADTLVGHILTDLFTPDLSAQVVPLLITALNGQSASGEICNFNDRFFVIAEPLQSPDGNVFYALAIVKPQLEEIDQTETTNVHYWNAVWSVIPDMLFRLNQAGIFVDFRASDSTGLYVPPEKFLGKAIEDIFPQALSDRFYNALSTLFDTGMPLALRYELPDEHGPRYFEARFVRSTDNEALVIVRDITEQHQYEIGIRQSERRFRQLAETAVDLIATHDLQGNLTYINPAGIAMLNLDIDRIHTYNIEDFITPDSMPALRTRQSERLGGNVDMFRYELDVLTTDQQPKTLDVSSSLITEPNQPITILVIARDISERKQVESQLRAQAEQIELFLQNTHDGLIIAKRNGTIVDVNPAYCKMSGRSRTSLIGMNINDLTVGLTDGELSIYRQQVTEHGSVRFATQHRHQDGHLIDMEISVYLVPDEEERLYIFMRDTTAEHMALATAERSAKRLAILHNIDAGILSAQSEYDIARATLNHIQQLVTCFTSAVMIFDYDDDVAHVVATYPANATQRDQVPTIPIEDIGPLDDLRAGKPLIVRDVSALPLQNPTMDAVRTLKIQSFINVPIRAEGQLFGALSLSHLETNAFSDEDVLVAQEVAQSLAVAIQQVRLHVQIRLYAAELEEIVADRTGELRRANERLLELDHLKSKFVSDVSHELRTPVNNLTMRLHLLEHDTPDHQAAHLANLKDQVNYISALIEDILQLSRLEVDKSSIRFQDVDANAIVQRVFADHQPAIENRGITFTQTLSTTLPIVIGDPISLTQVISNLVANALNYTEKGSITLHTRFDERTRKVGIDVEDTGMGIDPADKPYIFDRFYRGTSVAKSKIMGAGLGLGIAHEIIKMHGGGIEVESQPGHGSRFTVWLPTVDTLIDN